MKNLTKYKLKRSTNLKTMRFLDKKWKNEELKDKKL
jgi:hypothetical protein